MPPLVEKEPATHYYPTTRILPVVLQGPVGDSVFELVEAIVKEVPGARNDHQSNRRVFFELCCEFS